MAFVVFVFSQIIMGSLLPETKCADGWASKSIGLAGACSHHGGVDKTWQTLVTLLSLVLSIAVFRMIIHRNERGNGDLKVTDENNDSGW